MCSSRLSLAINPINLNNCAARKCYIVQCLIGWKPGFEIRTKGIKQWEDCTAPRNIWKLLQQDVHQHAPSSGRVFSNSFTEFFVAHTPHTSWAICILQQSLKQHKFSVSLLKFFILCRGLLFWLDGPRVPWCSGYSCFALNSASWWVIFLPSLILNRFTQLNPDP